MAELAQILDRADTSSYVALLEIGPDTTRCVRYIGGETKSRAD